MKKEIGLKCLKIKIKSLSEEARMIRKEENKLKTSWRTKKPIEWLKDKYGYYFTEDIRWDGYNTLRDHRIYDLRTEARAAHLAYAYIRGKYKYQDIENPNTDKSQLPIERIWQLIKKYGGLNHLFEDVRLANAEKLREWLDVEYIMIKNEVLAKK